MYSFQLINFFNHSLPDICLIKNNAKIAAQIAVELEALNNDCEGGRKLHASEPFNEATPVPVVIGGSILDVHYRVLDDIDNLEVSHYFAQRAEKERFFDQASHCPEHYCTVTKKGEGFN